MKEKIKTIYLVLGIILLVLIIIFIALKIVGSKVNPTFFTWSKEDYSQCLEKWEGEFGERICQGFKGRPSLFLPLKK